MSKIIYVCFRHTKIGPEIKNKILKICEELNPDHISARPTKLYTRNNIIYGLTNPTNSILEREANILLGKLFEKADDWDKIKTKAPDGSYAIFRADNNQVEVLTDCIGSRTVWYYLDEEIFIAATSQKAIIKFLGNFEFDERVIPWVISTGTLGPSHCWDKRLIRVPNDGTIILDRKKWRLEIKSNPVEFVPFEYSEKQQEILLEGALKETFNNIGFDLEKWAITLSGGHDSRAVVLLLKNKNGSGNRFKTITWGTQKAVLDKESDAYIAKKLAEKMRTSHQYFLTELSEEPVEEMINRFLNNGEGRIDHIPGYLDGFKLWQHIYQSGIEGIIRGDEVFGYHKVYSPLMARSTVGFTQCSDFSNLKKYGYIQSLRQDIPSGLRRGSNESLATWRDRIYQEYRSPIILSALSDLKLPYIEQFNPFLSRRIVYLTRKISDGMRSDKKLFKKIMKKYDVKIPYAKKNSNVGLISVLKKEGLVKLIKEELSSPYARSIFPETFLTQVVKNLQEKNDDKMKKIPLSLKDIVKNALPLGIKKFLSQNKSSLILDENILAFRVFIICRMHKILKTDNFEKI